MGFQLSNDDDNKSSVNTSPRIHSAPDTASNYSDLDFNPEEDNSVFIANQYQHTAPVTPSYSTSSSSATYKNSSFPPLLMIVGVLCNVIFLILAAFVFKKIGTGTYTDAELLSQLSSYSALTIIGNLLLLADAIIMVAKGNGFSLIVWFFLFQPAYYYKRCSKNGDSSLIATILLFALIASAGFYMQTVLSLAQNSSSTMQGDASATTEVISMTEDECREMFSGYHYTINDKEYYMLTMIESNVSNPTYSYVAATTGEPAHISVKGETTINGSSQNIELRFNYRTLDLQGYTLGLKTYTSSDATASLQRKMLENTPPQ